VWLLRITGHEAALLDGGLSGYDGELDRTEPQRPPAIFTARPWPADRMAGIEEVSRSSGDVVLDARDRARFRGEVEPVDPRPGHIPAARSLPARENLGVRERFLGVSELRERFAAVGVTEGTPVIAYCGSGVTACHTLLALERAGLGRGRLYPGSWSQYSSDPDRPAALGG
jgi:thiosulfate/3-mercaptopyruvate sulfurtransferase